MKFVSALLALLIAAPAFATTVPKAKDLNCEVPNAKGTTHKVHAKNQQTCENRHGKWLVVPTPPPAPTPAPAPTPTPAPAPAAPAPTK